MASHLAKCREKGLSHYRVALLMRGKLMLRLSLLLLDCRSWFSILGSGGGCYCILSSPARFLVTFAVVPYLMLVHGAANVCQSVTCVWLGTAPHPVLDRQPMAPLMSVSQSRVPPLSVGR